MVVRISEIKMLASQMLASQHCSRIDTIKLKIQIERRLGQQKAQKYFNLLRSYLSLKLSKSEFSKLCIGLVGRETICLHNELLRAIIKNASLAKTPPPKQTKIEGPLNFQVPNGYHRSSLQWLSRDVFPLSPRKGRTPNLRERKFKDRPSPLGPHGKIHSVTCEDLAPKALEQQSATEILSLGSRPNSVEEGEEVEQAFESTGIYSRSPVRAPLGIPISTKETRKVLHQGSAPSFYTRTCHNSGELPNTSFLNNRLEQKLEMEGLKTSVDCVSLLNNGLDVFLKRLIRPCLELAGSRSQHKHPNQVQFEAISKQVFSASMLDFRVAMESNPRLLGEDWPVHLEKVCLCAYEESIGTD